MPRNLPETRVPIDYEKFSKLSEVTGKTWADLAREIGRSPYYLTGIKNRMPEHPIEKYGCDSKNSLQKLEYLFLLNKYGYEFKYEAPVEQPKPVVSCPIKDVPPEQTDTYIATYFGVRDALKDFYKWMKEQEKAEEPVPKIVAPEEPADEVKIKKQKKPVAKG